MAAAMVPVTYLAGERLTNWKGGLIAAFFVTVVAGQYFYRSLFGFADHHIAEVLFSTLFCLGYIATLRYMRDHPVRREAVESFKIPALLAAGTGVAFILGLAVMPTMILFALLVAIYTLVQYCHDAFTGRFDESLLLLNVIVGIAAIVGLLLIGFNSSGLGMVNYTPGQAIAYIFLIIGTCALYGLRRMVREKPPHYYLVVILGIFIVALSGLMVAAPDLYASFIGNARHFFGQSATWVTIQEARPWSFADAWQSFGVGLLLMAGGFVLVAADFLKERKDELLFFLIWSVLMVVSTVQHIRYEYYLGANIALLAAYTVVWFLNRAQPDILSRIGTAHEAAPEEPEGKGGKKGKNKSQKPSKKPVKKPSSAAMLPLAICLLLGLLFTVTSVSADLAMADAMKYGGMTPDWRESLDWFGEHSPDTGVDYYAIYDEATFEYPPESYGVMSWWDYGHWITFISKRIPNANPFQAGVSGPNGSAAYFMSESEEISNEILDTLGTRYVITDVEMDSPKFWAMATWYNQTIGAAPYQIKVADQSGNGQFLYSDRYFQTTISRLHNFDGSMAEGTPEFTTQYGGRDYSYFVLAPMETVPALRHYRLVHESPTDVLAGSPAYDLSYVKIFEYVPGAVIEGEGTIEIPLMTDTGRTFTYRQESVDGMFIVPYPTTTNSGGITPMGEYTVVETGQVFRVTEEDVLQGRTVS
ncbi:hypothetical protein AZH53_10445 [Methanomicrobiaceae archaeon CYW5]|uniref:oligosaccharyl transferase, archaeosortase A system-associated n=1 Tax=Methanovulcanius yangii TaxID=1789227 RepID=UPI00387392BF|nr:hypothetical protein [Methanovulcanius yangii]